MTLLLISLYAVAMAAAWIVAGAPGAATAGLAVLLAEATPAAGGRRRRRARR